MIHDLCHELTCVDFDLDLELCWGLSFADGNLLIRIFICPAISIWELKLIVCSKTLTMLSLSVCRHHLTPDFICLRWVIAEFPVTLTKWTRWKLNATSGTYRAPLLQSRTLRRRCWNSGTANCTIRWFRGTSTTSALRVAPTRRPPFPSCTVCRT